MNFLNGWKTYIGLIAMVFGGVIFPDGVPQWYEAVATAIFGIGAIHKFEKLTRKV